MTTSDKEYQRVVQQVTTGGTTSDKEWQQMTRSDNKWPFRVIFLFFFWIRGVHNTKPPGESSLNFKGAFSALRQFLATESPLKMIKNAFYFNSKALFILKVFKFLSWIFGHVWKRLDK